MYRVISIHPLDLGLDNIVFNSKELALSHSKAVFVERNLETQFGDFNQALETHISIIKVTVMEERKK